MKPARDVLPWTTKQVRAALRSAGLHDVELVKRDNHRYWFAIQDGPFRPMFKSSARCLPNLFLSGWVREAREARDRWKGASHEADDQG